MKIKDMIEMPEVSSVFGELLDELGEKEVKLTLDEGKIVEIIEKWKGGAIEEDELDLVKALKSNAGEIIKKD